MFLPITYTRKAQFTNEVETYTGVWNRILHVCHPIIDDVIHLGKHHTNAEDIRFIEYLTPVYNPQTGKTSVL